MSSPASKQASHHVSTIFFFLLFGLMLFESGRLFLPFAGAIGSAIVLAIVFHPWYDAIGRRFPKLSPLWCAVLLDFIVVVLFVGPLIALIWAAVSEFQDLYPVWSQHAAHAGDWLHQNPTDTFPWLKKLPASITNQLNIHSEQVKLRLTEGGQRAVTVLAGVGTVAAQRLFDILLDITLLIFCLFFMFRDGKKMHAQFQALLPLSVKSKRHLSDTTQRTIFSVVRGNVLMSLAQTAMMAVGLLIVNADAIVLLSFLTFAATFIPTLGTALISVPVAIYFFLTGVIWKGVFFLLWGLLGMGILDNVLRPYLVGGSEEMSFFWLVFAILGGLEIFGVKGLLLGPLILSLMPVFFEIYRDRYLDIPED